MDQPSPLQEVPELLRKLEQQSIQLWAEGDELRFRARSGALTDEIRGLLRTYKPQIVATLKEKAREEAQPAIAPSIVSRGTEGRHPPTFLQNSWAQLYGASVSPRIFHVVGAIKLHGTLDASALRLSIQSLIRRHSILRARFEKDAATGEQWIRIDDSTAVPVASLGVLKPEALTQAMMDFTSARFDLQNGPLVRVGLGAVTPREHILIFCFHHAVCDGWSIPTLWSEVLAVYDGRRHGRTVLLPALPLQFTDFAHYQREWIGSEGAQRHIAYWRGKLKDARNPFWVPRDTVDAEVCRPPAPPHESRLSAGVIEKLRDLSRAEGTSLAIVALAAWVTLLARWSDTRDIFTWVCHAGRPRRELLGLIGCFFDTWILRAEIREARSFRDILRIVQATHREALRTLELPGVYMAGQFTSVRGEDLTGVTMFNYLPGASLGSEHRPDVEFVELPRTTRYLDSHSRMAAILTLSEERDSLRWILQHDPALLTDSTIDLASTELGRMLEQVATDPDAEVTTLANPLHSLHWQGD